MKKPKAERTLEKLIDMSAEGARFFDVPEKPNLSGKRIEF
jgi:hypothetical protein